MRLLAKFFLAFFILSVQIHALDLNSVMPIGTKVRIDKDVRTGSVASGEVAEYVGFRNDGWLLFNENGNPERESKDLPDGYLEWNPRIKDWPKQKSGIASPNPFFRLKNGLLISGLECYWSPVDGKLRHKITSKATDELRDIMRKIELSEKD